MSRLPSIQVSQREISNNRPSGVSLSSCSAGAESLAFKSITSYTCSFSQTCTSQGTWRALLGKKLRQNIDHPPIEINLTPGRQLPWSRLPTAKVHNFELNEEGTGATPEMRRLGRLKDTAYTDWETFVDVAGKKMGIDFGEVEVVERDMRMERLLECFHTLRCLVGTVVESAIILDRLVWVDELVKSEGRSDLRTSVVNLFDQATGSGRNVAIVVAPKVPSLTEV